MTMVPQDSVDSTDRRLAEARRALDAVAAGATGDQVETETLDCKRDKTRIGPTGEQQPGDPQSEDLAVYLAAELACLANHEGGALVVGVHDKQGGPAAFEGTGVDITWLKERVLELTLPPLVIAFEEETRAGQRIVVCVVPRHDGEEPISAKISKRGRVTPRRAGTRCVEMTGLKEMMAWADERSSYDWSASPSGRPVSEARPAAVDALRDFLRESEEPERVEMAELSDVELLSRLQLVRDGNLNRAGALLTAPHDRPRIEYLNRSTQGAASNTRVARSGRGVAEELRAVLDAIDDHDRTITIGEAETAAQGRVRAIPLRAVREALVNAIMHRDWNQLGPITVDHVGDELTVFSPGGFYGGVNEHTILTANSVTRNLVLGSALRSVRVAEREGTGIDRMYVELIQLGHAPPLIRERDGGVRATLIGGDPVPEVLQALATLPPILRRNPRVAITMDLLRHQPSFTLEDLGTAAQDDPAALTGFITQAEEARIIKPTAAPRPGNVKAWRLADHLRDILGVILPYYARPTEESIKIIATVAREQGSVRNSDVQDLLGISVTRASNLLTAAVKAEELMLAPGSKATGRGTAYVPFAAT